MSEPQAQRTLVKSPPELWAEVSDAGTLARHLGEFGDIRITRLEPETTVAWEGDRACGTVELEASGWGTKVTITASAVAKEASTTAPSPVVEEIGEEPAVEEEPTAVAAPAAEEEPEVVAATPADPEPEAEPERTESVAPPGFDEAPRVTAPAAPRKRGFFARLFGRRERVEVEPIVVETSMAKAAILAEPDSLVAIAVPAAPAPEPVEEPVAEELPAAVAPPEPAEGEIVVTAMQDDEVEAVLVALLDDLGSAHHRPFSRG